MDVDVSLLNSISPYDYVVYSGVAADNDCGYVGKYHSAVTLSYAPGELRTLSAVDATKYWFSQGPMSTMPYWFSDVPRGCYSSLSVPSCSFNTALSDFSKSEFDCSLSVQDSTNDFFALSCSTQLEFPTKIRYHDPAWVSCKNAPYILSEGAMDPPGILRAAPALAAPPPAPTNPHDQEQIQNSSATATTASNMAGSLASLNESKALVSSSSTAVLPSIVTASPPTSLASSPSGAAVTTAYTSDATDRGAGSQQPLSSEAAVGRQVYRMRILSMTIVVWLVASTFYI